jgi:nitroreductase
MFDAGIAAQTFCLAAHDLGIGSCIMGIFDEAKVAELLQLPEGQTVSAIIPIGVPKFAPDPTPRKEVSDLLSYR